jgi:hypothetical protein
MRNFENFVRQCRLHITAFFNPILVFYHFYKVLTKKLAFIVQVKSLSVMGNGNCPFPNNGLCIANLVASFRWWVELRYTQLRVIYLFWIATSTSSESSTHYLNDLWILLYRLGSENFGCLFVFVSATHTGHILKFAEYNKCLLSKVSIIPNHVWHAK